MPETMRLYELLNRDELLRLVETQDDYIMELQVRDLELLKGEYIYIKSLRKLLKENEKLREAKK